MSVDRRVIVVWAGADLMILSSTIDGFKGKMPVLKNPELIFFKVKACSQTARKTRQKILFDMLTMSNELNIISLRPLV